MDITIIIFSLLIPLITIIVINIMNMVDNDNEEEMDNNDYVKIYIVNAIITFFGIFILSNMSDKSFNISDMNVEVGLP